MSLKPSVFVPKHNRFVALIMSLMKMNVNSLRRDIKREVACLKLMMPHACPVSVYVSYPPSSLMFTFSFSYFIEPEIITGPEEMTETIGESISFICEAKGWPIPQIDWKLLQDGIELPLPTDDIHISVRSRGGPAEYEITSWLQISSIELRHNGVYICVAHNSQGEQRSEAQLVVGNYRRKQSSTLTSQIEGDL